MWLGSYSYRDGPFSRIPSERFSHKLAWFHYFLITPMFLCPSFLMSSSLRGSPSFLNFCGTVVVLSCSFDSMCDNGKSLHEA